MGKNSQSKPSNQKIVVSLFDHSGNMVTPWAKSGFLCYCVDLRHRAGLHRDGNMIRVGAEVRDWLPPFAAIAVLFAFPPCTHVAVSGARWFKDKGLGKLIESLVKGGYSSEWTRTAGKCGHGTWPKSWIPETLFRAEATYWNKSCNRLPRTIVKLTTGMNPIQYKVCQLPRAWR
jgi:hypothetical protein